jgi:predicted NUDIX family NTP pyrophosphohydrolase
MAKESAGLLVYRRRAGTLEVFLVHPGGPIWQNKDLGAWSIPKGEYSAGQDALEVAKRELNEETGQRVDGDFVPLAAVRQGSGKVVAAWAVEADLEATNIHSNTFSMEWPPRSGKLQEFPEVDRAGWFTVDAAAEKMIEGQRGLLAQLQSRLEAERKYSI